MAETNADAAGVGAAPPVPPTPTHTDDRSPDDRRLDTVAAELHATFCECAWDWQQLCERCPSEAEEWRMKARRVVGHLAGRAPAPTEADLEDAEYLEGVAGLLDKAGYGHWKGDSVRLIAHRLRAGRPDAAGRRDPMRGHPTPSWFVRYRLARPDVVPCSHTACPHTAVYEIVRAGRPRGRYTRYYCDTHAEGFRDAD